MTKKFKTFLITDDNPKIGDTTVCINRKSCNYGLTSAVYTELIDNDNWKTIVPSHKVYTVLELVQKAKNLKRKLSKISVNWTIEEVLDNVIENYKHVVLDDIKHMTLDLLKK